ncbi:MAG: response regulator [Sedimentisphaerales bacterium]
MKVLIAQDDTASRIELENSLKEWGYEILSAQNAEQAWQIIQGRQPQILLVDETMPKMDRLELCRKARTGSKYIFIIFLTSKVENEEINVDDYLSKPFDKRTLKSRMAIAARIINYENTANTQASVNVLHNVGNALNSINISAGIVIEKIANMEIVNLAKLAGILDEHADDLAEFLTNTPQGKNVIPYLKQLSIHLLQQQTEAAEKLCSLMKNIEDVKSIVHKQQNIKAETQEESIFLNELIENAIEINAAGLENHNIEIIREYDDISPVLIDKQRTLQILINLIDNAGYALSKSDNEPKMLKIRLSKSGSKKVKIEVKDNGIGINPENLDAIFEQGWTTKENGRGSGLHSSRLAANEMQAKLSAKSDGLNLGATFILEIPLKKAEVKNGKQN